MKTKKRSREKNGYALIFDLIIISLGILIAYFLSKTGLIDIVVDYTKNYSILASFVAGIFFTSAFTLAPASVALVHIAHNSPNSSVALWGALGAMCGDIILLLFIEDRFFRDLMGVLKPAKVKMIYRSLHFGFLKWLSPVIGALVIASPLPDEFGIALMGMSKVRISILMPIAFVMNVLGISILLGFANLIS